MNTSEYRVSIIKVIIKILIALFLIGLWICIALYCIEEVTDDDEVYFRSDAYMINKCDDYYYEREYFELYKYMLNNEAYDEIFDVYWEVADAYIDLQEYLKWKNVSTIDMQEAREMEQMYKEKVLNYAKNPAFPQNQKPLNELVEMLEE